MDITIFKDIKQTSQPFYRNINLVLKRIQDGASKDIVKKIRAEKDKSNRNILKQKLPAIYLIFIVNLFEYKLLYTA